MNPRVLELLKSPKNIQPEDLTLLKEEINSLPYIQNIRALHLYGVHLYDKENYQKELSLTAAYTTDKKILYQLINGRILSKPEPAEESKKEAIETVLETVAPPAGTEDKIVMEKHSFEEAACLLKTPQPEIKHIYINGERNRILFEGEENFLDEKSNETIDLESTLESGKLVTQKSGPAKHENNNEGEIIPEEKEELKEAEEIDNIFTPEAIIEETTISPEQEKQEIDDSSELSFHETEPFLPEVGIQLNNNEVKNKTGGSSKSGSIAEFTPETIINEEEITSETEEISVHDDHELSFHGLDSFMPDVTIQPSNPAGIIKAEAPASNINKHEEEMRRLIKEVEKKMKAKKEVLSQKKEDEPETQNHDINFAETQSFHAVVPSEQKVNVKMEEEKPQLIENELKAETSQETVVENISPIAEAHENPGASWKPMNFESHIPDSLIKKQTETSLSQVEIVEAPKQEGIVSAIEEMPELAEDQPGKIEEAGQGPQEEKEEVPVMNVSFFSSDWTINEPKKAAEKVKKTSEETATPDSKDSNVPGFLNTWQNWLKIDRTGEIEKTKTGNKVKVIDSFIENNPKISQLKEDSNYIVKEKKDDISHLMTETLANLYFEQKLYTKAINAFQILMNKHPEKKEYFEAKIREINDTRGKS